MLFRSDERFLHGLKEAEVAESTPQAVWSIYLMLAVVVSAVVWASLAKVDEITKADARVVPDGREQVISSLEGGILRTLLVREGMVVEQGQDLVQLDPTRFEAQQNEGHAKMLAYRGTAARLTAEATGKPLGFPKEVQEQHDIVLLETEAYDARKQALEEAVSVNRRSLGLLNRELAMSERMAERGLMSEVEVMRLRRQANDLMLQIQERINRFRQDASTELVRIRTEMAQLEEQQVVKQDVLQRSVLKSPVRGLVKNIRIVTLGGVVSPGAAIMEIVPLGQRVLVEARIKPSEIGFIRTGLPVEVKLSAYDYYTYGGMTGVIEYISPDALGDDGKSGGADNTYYRAMIRATPPVPRTGRRTISIMPGMTGSVEIRTGDRSVLAFLLRPLLKSQEAFREK